MSTFNPVPFDPKAYAQKMRSSNSEFRQAYDELASEFEALSVLLDLRHSAGLTQADIAEKMGVSQPVVARIERSLITHKHVPSLATLRRYAKACGKRLVICFEPS